MEFLWNPHGTLMTPLWHALCHPYGMPYGTLMAILWHPYGTLRFNPGSVNAHFTQGLIGWVVEVCVLKGMLYSLAPAADAPLLDLVAYGGYVFVGVSTTLFSYLLWHRSFYPVILFTRWDGWVCMHRWVGDWSGWGWERCLGWGGDGARLIEGRDARQRNGKTTMYENSASNFFGL